MKRLWEKFCQIAGRKQEPKKEEFKPVTLETPRLIVRELEMSDAERIYQMTSAPGFKYYCFDGTREKVMDFLGDAFATRKNTADGKRPEYLLGVEVKDTKEFVGHVSLQRVNYVAGYEYDVNFFIDQNVQNKGYGREAIVNLMRFALEDLGLPGFTVTIHPNNGPSLSVAESEGYQRIGETQIKTVFGEEPRVILRLTKEEFYEQRKKDKKPIFLVPPAANENKPVVDAPKKASGNKPN